MEALRRIGWKEELTRGNQQPSFRSILVCIKLRLMTGLGMAADVIWYCGVQVPAA
jgi:hypothetical protein